MFCCRPHPAITATLLDFLCRIIPNFYPAEQEKVKNGIISSLKTIVDKRVLPSLSPLFDNPKLDNTTNVFNELDFTDSNQLVEKTEMHLYKQKDGEA